MANIQDDINQIATARYGREVRGSIVDALTLMNEESSEAIDKAVTAQDSASASAEEAREYAERLVDFSGGTISQVLTKNSGEDYDYSWQDSRGGGAGFVEVTYADYQEHREEYEASDNVYIITDKGEKMTADDVLYEDTTVGAELDQISENVDANTSDIAEIKEDLAELEKEKSFSFGDGCKVRRVGNQVYIHTLGWARPTGVLPYGYRPVEAFYFPTTQQDLTASFNLVGANGIFEKTTVGQLFSVSWYTADDFPTD